MGAIVRTVGVSTYATRLRAPCIKSRIYVVTCKICTPFSVFGRHYHTLHTISRPRIRLNLWFPTLGSATGQYDYSVKGNASVRLKEEKMERFALLLILPQYYRLRTCLIERQNPVLC